MMSRIFDALGRIDLIASLGERITSASKALTEWFSRLTMEDKIAVIKGAAFLIAMGFTIGTLTSLLLTSTQANCECQVQGIQAKIEKRSQPPICSSRNTAGSRQYHQVHEAHDDIVIIDGDVTFVNEVNILKEE